MHIYAFGSICRGEMDAYSDVDLLAIVDDTDDDSRFDPMMFSIYTYARLTSMWKEGNPFAWHLRKEARLVFSSDGNDWIDGIGDPSPYSQYLEDFCLFNGIISGAINKIQSGTNSIVFELSMIFLAIRNLASCFSLGCLGEFNFSRRSPVQLGVLSLSLTDEEFSVLERARILCTRGAGKELNNKDVNLAIGSIDKIVLWIDGLTSRSGFK